MATLANIAIADGESTPVVHTFVPARRAENLVELHNRAAGQLSLYEKLTIGTRLASESNAGQKATFKLALPSDKTVEGETVVKDTILVNVEFLMPKTSSTQERKNARILASNLLLNSIVADAIDEVAQPV